MSGESKPRRTELPGLSEGGCGDCSRALAALTVLATWCALPPPTAIAQPAAGGGLADSQVLAAEQGPSDDDAYLASPPPAARMLESFEQVLAWVRSRSPEYLMARDELDRARARSRVALGAVLPKLAALGTFTHELITTEQSLGDGPVTIPSQDVWGAGVALTWPVGDARAWHAIGTTRHGVLAAERDFAEARRRITRAVVDAVVAAVAAERLAELDRNGLRAALERLALTRTKLELGGARALDVDRAHQDVIEARKLVSAGDETLQRARETLGSVLGSERTVAVNPNLQMSGFERAVAASCRLAKSIEDRADVAAARARLEIAERGITDAGLRLAPTLSLASALAWDSGVVYGPNATWNVRATLSVPIWDGGERYGVVRESRALASQAKHRLSALRTQALVEAAQAQRGAAIAIRARDLAEQARALALQIDQRTRLGYVQGIGTSLELITSAQALRRAYADHTVLELRVAHARMLGILSNADCFY